MSVDGVKSKGKTRSTNPNELNPELGKNLPGSPKSIKAEQRVKDAEGKHTHLKPEKEHKKPGVDPTELSGNSIPASRFPTSAFD